MSFQKNVLLVAQEINREIKGNGLFDKKTASDEDEKHLTYDELITNKSLRRKTRKLFLDGHHARAVEEAYKLLDNLVKKKVGLQDSELTGASLMRHVFSKNHPLLRFNEGKTASEQDEQLGDKGTVLLSTFARKNSLNESAFKHLRRDKGTVLLSTFARKNSLN